MVLIVGAGPTGLVLAIWLRKKGIPVRIVDQSSGPGLTSRALVVHARTLEFYQQLGFADQLIEAGILVHELVIRRGGKIVAKPQLAAFGKDLTPFPHILFCSQDVHEEILVKILKDLGTEVERNTNLVEFRQDKDRVHSVLSGPKGREEFSSDYLCGCDGAHSTVRKELGIGFPGGTYEHIFYVADVLVEKEAMDRGLEVALGKNDFCIVMPIRLKDSVRLTGIVPPEKELKKDIQYEDIDEVVKGNAGLKVKKVRWFSIYHVHHRVAYNFKKGRVFLAGDAGHIHSPVGGQGMNTGIGDAVNLAWKIADVLLKKSDKKILESYEPERVAFAKVLIRSTDTAFKMVTNSSWWASYFRYYLVPVLLAFITRFKVVLKLMFSVVSQTRIHYRDSFLSEGKVGAIHAGDRLPWLGNNYDSLNILDWQVHIYGKASLELKKITDGRALKLFEFEFSQKARRKGFVQDAVYLIRPDGHIAFVHRNQSALENYLARLI